MRNPKVKKMVGSAMIAALYFALSLPFMTLNFGAVQLRVSEAFTLLPIFSPNAIVGITLGCVLVNALGAVTQANLLGPIDIVVGSLATLMAAYCTWRLRGVRTKGLALAAALPPVLFNAVIIGLELCFVLTGGFNLPFFLINALQVGLGELIACYCLGVPMCYALEKTGAANKIF